MERRNVACLAAAVLLGFGAAATATGALAKPLGDVIVQGNKIDPTLQRTVPYGDLNLAYKPGQRTLAKRIWRTATGLCLDLNGVTGLGECTSFAVHSADDQVAAAIDRARRQLAGLPVGPSVAISMAIGGQ